MLLAEDLMLLLLGLGGLGIFPRTGWPAVAVGRVTTVYARAGTAVGRYTSIFGHPPSTASHVG